MKKQNSKDYIIECSAELFNIYGYHACSLSHIMKATGLQKGGIYNHFSNKDEIAIAAFNYNYDRVLERFREKLDIVHTPTEKLLAVIDAFVSFYHDPIVKGGGCPIFNTATDATNTHPELRMKAKSGIAGLRKYIELKLHEGVKAQEFRVDLNIEKVSSLMVATLEGALIMARVNEDEECLEYASEYIKSYLYKKIVIKD